MYLFQKQSQLGRWATPRYYALSWWLFFEFSSSLIGRNRFISFSSQCIKWTTFGIWVQKLVKVPYDGSLKTIIVVSHQINKDARCVHFPSNQWQSIQRLSQLPLFSSRPRKRRYTVAHLRAIVRDKKRPRIFFCNQTNIYKEYQVWIQASLAELSTI